MQLALRRMATVIALAAVAAFALPLGILSLHLQRELALADLEGVQLAAAAGVLHDAPRGGRWSWLPTGRARRSPCSRRVVGCSRATVLPTRSP